MDGVRRGTEQVTRGAARVDRDSRGTHKAPELDKPPERRQHHAPRVRDGTAGGSAEREVHLQPEERSDMTPEEMFGVEEVLSDE